MVWDRYKYLTFLTEKITLLCNISTSSGLFIAWMNYHLRLSDFWVSWHCNEGMMDYKSNLCTRKSIVLMGEKKIDFVALYISLMCSFKIWVTIQKLITSERKFKTVYLDLYNWGPDCGYWCPHWKMKLYF